ncbi:MAG TPA: hypothetical protein VMF60_03495 [Acidimicrobiales bacterium]|nr:hypothetical protein [Acidimicrobiales bacterium]
MVKSTGDGALAVFDGPARAVRCAGAITERVRTLGIEARAGVHTGEVELRGEDVGGIAVHIGARVAGAADAGQVSCPGPWSIWSSVPGSVSRRRAPTS